MNLPDLWPLVILAVAVSVDGFSVGVAYGLRNIKIGIMPLIIISSISALAIYMTISLGAVIAELFTEQFAERLGGVLLIGIGLWIIYSAYIKCNNHQQDTGKIQDNKLIFSLNLNSLGIMIKILKKPVTADLDGSGSIGLLEAIILGFALALDALGAGLGAGLTGFSGYILPVCIGLSKFIFIKTGLITGDKIGNIVPSRFEVFPGLIIILLGIVTLIS